MITDREEFIKICGLLAHSDIQLEDCNYITNFIVELGKEIEQKQELRSWLEDEISKGGSSIDLAIRIHTIQEVLNKLNELEGGGINERN